MTKKTVPCKKFFHLLRNYTVYGKKTDPQTVYNQNVESESI